MFLDVNNLDKIKWPAEARAFELRLHSSYNLPKESRVNKDLFKLHCVPAVNLFRQSCEPLSVNGQELQYPILTNKKIGKPVFKT